MPSQNVSGTTSRAKFTRRWDSFDALPRQLRHFLYGPSQPTAPPTSSRFIDGTAPHARRPMTSPSLDLEHKSMTSDKTQRLSALRRDAEQLAKTPNVMHCSSLNNVRATFDKHPTTSAVFFETRNFGWVILRTANANGRRIFKF